MYKDVIQFLDQRRLKEAFTQLYAFLEETDCRQLQPEVENLQTTYNYMLQYAAQGIDDPERNRMYVRLCRRGYELADQAMRTNSLMKGRGYLSDKFRTFRQYPPHSYQELCLILENIGQDMESLLPSCADEAQRKAELKKLYERRRAAANELFDKIWASLLWTEEEAKEATELIHSVLIHPNDLAVMVSAVSLNLFAVFDSRKFQFLTEAYRMRPENVINQRALAGIVLAAYLHEKRLGLYPEQTAALSLLADLPDITRQVYNIQTLLLLSRETDKINRTMREDILPQIMNNAFLQNPDFKISDIGDMEDWNPEWKDSMDKISDRIMKLNELQSEGADTYMSAFSHLKSFPFFRQAAHWFYPFDKQMPEVSDVLDRIPENEKAFTNALLSSPLLCNSDKYSFCISLSSLPPEYGKIMGVKEGFGQPEEDIEGKNNPNVVCRQYIHDLYRFYKLWSYRGEQDDIFAKRLTVLNAESLYAITNDEALMKQTADYLLSRDFPEEAEEMYHKLEASVGLDAETYQKIGFARQKQKRYAEAVKSYERAYEREPGNIWTLKHLGQCYKRLNFMEKAITCFKQVEAAEPNDLNVLFQLGQCLVVGHRYEEALPYFFKVEYLHKEPANAWRAIGWCYFMTGKYDEALRFYGKLHEGGQTQVSDWLNAGHVHMALHQMQQAVACYGKANSGCRSHDEFVKLLLNDLEALRSQHVKEEDIYLIPDLV